MKNINSEALAKSVGKAIGRQRQQAGLTQEQVAEHLKIGMEAVSRMERGLVVPTVVRLAELAQLFGCELLCANCLSFQLNTSGHAGPD